MTIRPFLARFAVCIIVNTIVRIRRLALFLRTSQAKKADALNIFLIGAFYNTGWIRAHALPIAKSPLVKMVYVITDDELPTNISNVQFISPSHTAKKVYGRGLARIITLLKAARNIHPEIYIGYHIMPNAPLALLAATLFNGKSVYQMTGGPIQIRGGGHLSENPLLSASKTRSPQQEKRLFRLVREFDKVVVRGNAAAKYIKDNSLALDPAIITAAIDTNRFKPTPGTIKDIDIITISRLVENFKGLERLLDVVSELKANHPNICVHILGDGPAKEILKKKAADLSIATNVTFAGKCDNVAEHLNRAKLFVLLSPNEGMSIALLEALSTGLPAVVTEVGELKDAIQNDCGKLVVYRTPKSTAKTISYLLNNHVMLKEFSTSARKRILTEFSIEAVSRRWTNLLSSTTNRSKSPKSNQCKPLSTIKAP